MTIHSATGSAPVFNCVVHVGRSPDGSFVAHVANLPGIQATAKTEREALASVVATFKSTVASFHEAGEAIPFVENYPRPQAGQTERFIAVHL
jgi:predicted RNase H-like HicB family nuclease